MIDPILQKVATERARQDAKWGEQNHPDGTGEIWRPVAEVHKETCDHAAQTGDVTWLHILREEVYEAFAERDPEKLTTELIQVMAVCKAWIECIARREQKGS